MAGATGSSGSGSHSAGVVVAEVSGTSAVISGAGLTQESL